MWLPTLELEYPDIPSFASIFASFNSLHTLVSLPKFSVPSLPTVPSVPSLSSLLPLSTPSLSEVRRHLGLHMSLPVLLWFAFVLLLGLVAGVLRRRRSVRKAEKAARLVKNQRMRKELDRCQNKNAELAKLVRGGVTVKVLEEAGDTMDATGGPYDYPRKPRDKDRKGRKKGKKGKSAPLPGTLEQLPKLEGHLWKKASKALVGWQKRYFVADGHSLSYWKTKGSHKVREALDLKTLLGVGAGSKSTQFELRFKQRTYLLCAPTAAISTLWQQHLSIRHKLAKQPKERRSKSIRDNQPSPPAYEDAQIEEQLMLHLHCTAKEVQLLRALQAQVRKDEDEDVPHGTALRFLRARDGDVAAAAQMLGRDLDWRRCTLPSIDAGSAELELRKGKYLFLGRDMSNQPVVMVDGSKMGFDTYDDVDGRMHALVFAMETVFATHLKPMDKFTLIYSRVDAAAGSMDLNFVQCLGNLLSDHFPQRLKQVFVVGVDPLFLAQFKVLQLFLAPSTAKKIVLVNSDAAEAKLREAIPDSILPTTLGGSGTRHEEPFDMSMLTDPDGYKRRTGHSL